MSSKTAAPSTFDPKPTGKSYWRLRLSYILNSFRIRPARAILLGVSVYLVAFNVGIRWWKGPEHPINRLQWQLMKAKGELPREMLDKEDVIYKYYKSRLYNRTDSFPQLDN